MCKYTCLLAYINKLHTLLKRNYATFAEQHSDLLTFYYKDQ